MEEEEKLRVWKRKRNQYRTESKKRPENERLGSVCRTVTKERKFQGRMSEATEKARDNGQCRRTRMNL